MRSVLFAVTLAFTAVPALAGGFGVELPTLTWPQGDQAVPSTKGCEATPPGSASICK